MFFKPTPLPLDMTRKRLVFFHRAAVLLGVLIVWCGWAWTTAWAEPPQVPPTSKPSTQTSQAARRAVVASDPFAVGVQWSRDSEWEKALQFFLTQKRQSLLELSLPDRVRLFAFLGVIYANLLQSVESRGAFEKALLLDPCARLPLLRSIAPQIRVEFASMRSSFARACAQQTQEHAQALLRKKNPPRPAERDAQPKKALLDPIMQPSKAMHLSAWIVTAVGGAALAAGCAFGGLALMDDVQRQQTPYTMDGTQQYLRLAQQAQERAWAANVFYGVAGALLFTGFALHVSKWVQESIDAPSHKREPQPPQPRVVLYGTF